MEILIGALIGAGLASILFAWRLKLAHEDKVFAEAKYNSLKGFFDARVLAVKAKADEAKKRA